MGRGQFKSSNITAKGGDGSRCIPRTGLTYKTPWIGMSPHVTAEHADVVSTLPTLVILRLLIYKPDITMAGAL